VAFVDPPRPAAAAAVAACRRAGITVVMITGDQPATALAVARDLGLAEAPAQLAHGRDVAAWDDAALAERAPDLRVYARTSPEQKLRIVRAWQAGGAVVAMTGDGVNDAPALKRANIGVAMGITGTDVTKDASAMVLLDDEFATLVAAVAEGRRIYDNVRKCLLYLLSGNAGEVLVMAVGVLVGLPLPLLPLQLLWINLVTDGLPALALAADPADDGVLERPPRRPDQPLADRAFLGVLSASALLTAAVTLGVFVAALEAGEDVALARSLAFSTLVVEELMRAFVFRSRTRIVWEVGLFSNSRLLFVVLLTFSLQLLVQHVEPIARLLGAVPPRGRRPCWSAFWARSRYHPGADQAATASAGTAGGGGGGDDPGLSFSRNGTRPRIAPSTHSPRGSSTWRVPATMPSTCTSPSRSWWAPSRSWWEPWKRPCPRAAPRRPWRLVAPARASAARARTTPSSRRPSRPRGRA
jgi:Ca2+-transporting ATPase